MGFNIQKMSEPFLYDGDCASKWHLPSGSGWSQNWAQASVRWTARAGTGVFLSWGQWGGCPTVRAASWSHLWLGLKRWASICKAVSPGEGTPGTGRVFGKAENYLTAILFRVQWAIPCVLWHQVFLASTTSHVLPGFPRYCSARKSGKHRGPLGVQFKLGKH